MASTTSGYDVLVIMSRWGTDLLVGALYDMGTIPSYIQGPPEGVAGIHPHLELFLRRPSLSFHDSTPKTPQSVTYTQPIIVRADDILDEIASQVAVTLPFGIHEETIDDTQTQRLHADLTGLTIDDVEVGEEIDVLLGATIAGKIVDMLRTQVIDLPMTLPVIGDPVHYALRISKTPLHPLQLFANLDGRSGGFTDEPVPKGGLVILSNEPANITVFLNWDFVHAALLQALQDRGIVPGATLVDNVDKKVIDLSIDTHVGDVIKYTTGIDIGALTLHLFDATLERIELTKALTFQLAPGLMRVTGGVKAVIDNAFDVTADFDAHVGFGIHDGKLSGTVLWCSIDADEGWLTNVIIDVLLGPLGPIIMQQVDVAIERAAEAEVGGLTKSLTIPTESVVVSGIEITNATQSDKPMAVFVRPVAAGSSGDAIAIALQAGVKVPSAPIKDPSYLIAHRVTKQFHLPGCRFVEKMNPSNQLKFVRASDAVRRGYDGCRLCEPAYDQKGAGAIDVLYSRPAAVGLKREVPITVTGVFDGTTEQPQLAKPWTRTGELVIGDKYAMWHDQLAIDTLTAGPWTITLTDGDWTATKHVIVKPAKMVPALFAFGKDAPPTGVASGTLHIRYRAKGIVGLPKQIPAQFTAAFTGTDAPPGSTTSWKKQGGLPLGDTEGWCTDNLYVGLAAPGAWTVTVSDYGWSGTKAVEVVANADVVLEIERPG